MTLFNFEMTILSSNVCDMPFGSSCAALKLKTLHFDALVIVIWHQFKAPYYEVAQLLPA